MLITSTGALTTETTMSDLPNPVATTYTPSRIPTDPPIIPFSSLSSYDPTIIHRHTATIAATWCLVSSVSVFPGQYLPDSDSNNWGISLLDSIQRLARLTCTAALMTEAVGYVVQSVDRENAGMYTRI
jgi:hypothetical protein